MINRGSKRKVKKGREENDTAVEKKRKKKIVNRRKKGRGKNVGKVREKEGRAKRRETE